VHRKIYNDERRLPVVVRRFVATSPTAMWHLCYRGQWWGHVSLLTSAPHRCTSFIVCRLCRSSVRPSVVGSGQRGLCLLCEKRNGGGESLTWMNADGNDNLRRHRLHDVARPLMCPVVAVSHLPLSIGLVTWRCHIVVVVGMCSGGSRRRTMGVEGGWRLQVVGSRRCGWWWW